MVCFYLAYSESTSWITFDMLAALFHKRKVDRSFSLPLTSLWDPPEGSRREPGSGNSSNSLSREFSYFWEQNELAFKGIFFSSTREIVRISVTGHHVSVHAEALKYVSLLMLPTKYWFQIHIHSQIAWRTRHRLSERKKIALF